MKAVSQTFKNNIKELGKEIDSVITYTISGTNYELGNENLNSVSLHYEGNILKSVMKQLDIESLTDIPLGTEVNYQFGLKVADAEVVDYRDNYEYIDYGNFIVYSSEKQEADNSYKIVCYDKMLYSMKDYETMSIAYPITIRDYISAICSHLNLTFANLSDTFVNYNQEIPNELYLDEDGNSLDYTFRDVLDQLAQVTASTICINDDEELELRYINNTGETINAEYLKDVNVNFGEIYGPVNTIAFKRSEDSDIVYYPDPLPANPIELSISNNQILNQNNRADYLQDIYNQLNGLTYSINDFSSTGIAYLELCDKYNVTITKQDEDGNTIETNTYSCIMLNDELNVTQGLEEHVYTNMPVESVTDYNTASKDDRELQRTTLIVNKQEHKITAVAETVEIKTQKIDDDGNTTSFKTAGYTFDSDGLLIEDESGYKSLINTTGTYYYDNDTMVGKYTKDIAIHKDLVLYGAYYYGVDDAIDIEQDFEISSAMFVSQLYTYDDGNGNTEPAVGHFYNGD